MKKVLLLMLIAASISGCTTARYKLSDSYDFTFFESESVRIDKARDLQTGMFKFSKDGKSLFFMESHLIQEKSMLLSNNYRIDSLIHCDLETGRLKSIVSADQLSGTRIGRFSISQNGRYAAYSIFDDSLFLGLYCTDIIESKTRLIGDGSFKSPSVFFFSPEESALIIYLDDSRLLSWGLTEGRITAELNLNKKYGILEISEDSGFFGAVLEDNSGKLINSDNLDTGLNIAEYSEMISSWDPKSLAISPDNAYAAFTGKQKDSPKTSIYLRNLATGSLEIVSSTDKKNPSLKFSYSGKFLILIDGNGEWEIVNTASGENHKQRGGISKIIFSGNSNHILAIDKNKRSVKKIDLERPEQAAGKLQLDKDIMHAEFINDNRGILAITEREMFFHDLGSDRIRKTISHRNRQFAIHPENNTLCYADKNGFALMNLLFDIKIADYILLDQNDYIFKPAGNGYIITAELAKTFPERRDNLFFIDKKIDLTRPVLPPVISIKDISLTKSFIRAGEDLELEITVINSGPGDSGNLRMEIETDTNLAISGDTVFPVVEAGGGMESIRIIIKSGKMTESGRASLSLRLFEEDFGIHIQGKQIDFQIMDEPQPEVILAKHKAEEFSSTNNNSIIDLNEIIDVAFYIQNIGRADSNISAYSIECSQQGVKLLGYVDSAKEITDKPIIENLASGDYVRIEQRYFINSFFKDRNLNFQISVDNEKTNLLTESLSLPVNKKLAEQGRIRTVSAEPQREAATISIKNIEDAVPATPSSGTEPSSAVQYLTVFDFSSDDQTDSEVRYITSLVTETVNKSRLFKLIDSEERDRLLKELNFSLSAVSIEENTLEVGRLVPANYMILGTIDKVENSYLVTMKMIKTETGELISSRQSLIRSFGEIPEVIPQITLELIHF